MKLQEDHVYPNSERVEEQTGMNELMGQTSKTCRMIGAVIAIFFVPLHLSQAAEAPTFSNEVVRILQQNCQLCHQPGGIAPMPLGDSDRVPRNDRV